MANIFKAKEMSYVTYVLPVHTLLKLYIFVIYIYYTACS